MDKLYPITTHNNRTAVLLQTAPFASPKVDTTRYLLLNDCTMPTPCQRCETLLGELKVYIPDSSPMCNPADETACEPCRKLAILDSLIDDGRKILITIENHRRIVNMQMNEHHDRLINRFPLEIAAEIFQMCLPSDMMDIDLQNKSSKHILAAPLVLSTVCRKWRAIAHSTPRLWVDIPLHLHSSNFRSLPSLAKDWIKRSGQLSLSINLCINSNQNLHPALISPLIAVLNEYSTRWEQLKYDGPSSLLSQFASHASGISSLKTLKLRPFFSRNIGAFNLGEVRLRPTNLLELSAIHLKSVSGVDWEYITRINLNALSTAECLEALRRAPNLTHFSLSRILDSSSRGGFPNCPNPLVRDKIEHLELGGDMYKEILQVLKCPSLRGCKVHANGKRVDVAALAPFFTLSSCGLESLSLLDAIIHTNDIGPLFASVPALHHLHITLSEKSCDNLPRAILHRLSELSMKKSKTGRVTTQTPVYLRNLRSIYFSLPHPLEWTLLTGCLNVPGSLNPLRQALDCVTIAVTPHKKNLQPRYVAISRHVLCHLRAIRTEGLNLKLQVGEARQDLLQISFDYYTSI